MAIPDEEIVELFFEISRLSLHYPNNQYKDSWLYSGQSRCLMLLANLGSMSQRELADKLGIRPASVSESVRKHEAKGWVTRIPAEDNKKKLIISLTEEGKQQLIIWRHKRRLSHSEMLSSFSEEEKELFYGMLKKLKSYYDSMADQERKQRFEKL